MIADSEHTRRDIVRLLGVPAERIVVIPLGVDVAFRQVADAEALAAVRGRYALPETFIPLRRHFRAAEGLDTLVDAYATLADVLSDDLVIAGKRGWYTESLFAQVRRLGLERRVHFTDYVADVDLPAL